MLIYLSHSTLCYLLFFMFMLNKFDRNQIERRENLKKSHKSLNFNLHEEGIKLTVQLASLLLLTSYIQASP